MKLAKLSLAAIVVAGLATSSFAAGSLADAFKNGKVSGALQLQYFHTKDNTTTSNGILNTGVDLSYTTGEFNGFNAKLTFQGTDSPTATLVEKAAFQGDMYGPGATMSEAYLGYSMNGISLKAGRQYISTPLVGVSGSRTTKESFEGYVAAYTGIPNTTLIGAYVYKYQTRTDGANWAIGKFNKIGDKGAWTIVAKNNSIKPLKLTGAYAVVSNAAGDLKVSYVDAAYSMMAGNTKIGLAANYYNDSNAALATSTTSTDGSMYSVKVDATMGKIYAKLAYGKTSNKSNATAGLGNGPGDLYNNTVGGMYFNDNSAGVKNIAVLAKYNLGSAGLAVGYNRFSNGVATTFVNYSVYGATASYKFAGTLKGLSTVAKYEVRTKHNTTDLRSSGRFRFYATYAF